MKRKLGCLTPGGLAAALITLAVVIGLMVVGGGSILSPGALNAQAAEAMGGVQSHAETGGRCAACHPAPWSGETMADRCLACHTEIGLQAQDPDSLHGSLGRAGEALTCRFCHPEHRGATAALTEIDTAAFPHQATGYSLEGHQEMADGSSFACADCHGENLAGFEPAVCGDCHRELDAAYLAAHEADMGADCLACHDGVDRYGDDFDHDRLAFALDGGHETLPCSDCHAGARSPADLQAAPQECAACHAEDDAHQGQFGQDCAACHTAASWEEATFDHDQTDFALTGAHVEVACEACHANGVYEGTPADCAACHAEDDAHQGQFGQDCAGCHTTASWEEATFNHDQTDFALTGAHVEVACEACHANGVYEGTPTDCAACHPDPEYHAGLLGTDCAACHGTDAWSPAGYDQAHTFPLDHGEEGVSSCRTCHPQSLATYTCYECHEHQPAEVEREHLEEGISDFQDCVECHPTGQEEEGEGEEGD